MDSFQDYLESKRRKLNDQISDIRSYGIFNGLKFYVDGYTQPSQLDLRDLIVKNGGEFFFHHSSSVTHIIATHLPESKLKILRYIWTHFKDEKLWFCRNG